MTSRLRYFLISNVEAIYVYVYVLHGKEFDQYLFTGDCLVIPTQF
jgi:hypothetical protein